jgi:hypothetical protein
MSRSLFILLVSVSLLQHNVSAQQTPAKKPFVSAVRALAASHSGEINFCRAEYFFSRNEPDSTLFYSMKQLHTNSAPELRAYCHFFRGVSFKKKRYLRRPKRSSGL